MKLLVGLVLAALGLVGLVRRRVFESRLREFLSTVPQPSLARNPPVVLLSYWLPAIAIIVGGMMVADYLIEL